MLMLYKWTKKIDEMHYAISGESTTLCGKPMLGSNYEEEFPERKVCDKCNEKLSELK